jgi:DNA-binding NtrC family response regulator
MASISADSFWIRMNTGWFESDSLSSTMSASLNEMHQKHYTPVIPMRCAMALQTTVKRLLVVEDDPDQSRAVCDRLELYGYAVSCAQDGQIAMDMLQADSFDGVLLDLNLPQVPGIQLLANTRQSLSHLPVLVMSASSSRLRAAKESNLACGYIAKPFGSAQFKQAVQRCFGPAYQATAS